MTEWSEQWTLYDYAESGWKLLDEQKPYRPSPATPTVEVVPKQEAEQKLGELRDRHDAESEKAEAAEQKIEEARKAIEGDLGRLGLVRCMDCNGEGVVTGTETERDPDGSIRPVPVPERCPTCDGTCWVNQRAGELRFERDQALKQGAKAERERLLSADSLRAIARHRHNSDHEEGFDDLEWDDLQLERQLRAMDHAKADLLSAIDQEDSSER